MKIEYKIYCHKHGDEIQVSCWSELDNDHIGIEIESCCSQCQSEAYEKGIESMLSKGWESK